MAEGERAGFFGQRSLDEGLPDANAVFWTALIEHILSDGVLHPHAVLDVGCHSGGLISRLIDVFQPQLARGIEPVAALRAEAADRLGRHDCQIALSDLAGWDDIEPGSINLMTCHEVLYLEPDLAAFMRRTATVLARGASAYVVLGCHAENPVWQAWKPAMQASGVAVYDRSPFEVLSAAADAGLKAAVQPLRRSGWVNYDPRQAIFRYADTAAMFDHQYRHKLLFRFSRP